MTLLTAPTAASVFGVSEPRCREIFRSAVVGKPWRGHLLPVVQMNGQRGGKGGVTWGLDLSQATPELLDSYPALKDHVGKSTLPVNTTCFSDTDAWRIKVQQERHKLIRPAIATEPRSKERTDILQKIATSAEPCWGTSERPCVKTLRGWLKSFEERGLAGLMPKAPANKGQPRVLVSRKWDKDIGLKQEEKEEVSEELARYTRTLIAKSMSSRKAQQLAGRKLLDLSIEAGCDATDKDLPELCKVTQKYIDRFKEYRRVARHDFDNKKFFDSDLPRIGRDKTASPMEILWGDVHPVDVFVPLSNKEQARVRLIGWMDDYSRHLWVKIAVLGKGNGIKQVDIADSLYDVVFDPAGGVPNTLYLDNGSEYFAIAEAMASIPNAISTLEAYGGTVKAKPYNGPAKGVIEHAFSTLEQGYFRHIEGWIGGDRTNKKTHAVGKPVKGFSGTIEELVEMVTDMVAAYNDAPQGGLLNGISPRKALQNAINDGWLPVCMDEDAFDFAFSRSPKKAPTINQGGFNFESQRYVSDATCVLGAGDKVDIRVPLRSSAAGVFLIIDGKPLPDRVFPDVRFHPLDRSGAVESARRKSLQEKAIKALKKGVDPKVDPAAEILKGVDRTPLSAPPAAIIRLAETTPANRQIENISERRNDMQEFAREFGFSGYNKKRGAEGN